ncbi:non-ribosomal peptide synthetase, partial [Geitlerinema splendidum]|nr:non-ribosomal peptide synthetase [Geitlerinema splendidum]
FLGRIDDQVKIRGFRIELGEIESTLSQHGDVTQAVVVAREDEPGDKKLVAYVIPQEKLLSSLEQESLLTSSSHQEFAVLRGESLPGLTETLRNHLSHSLPDYMIPAFFVFLDKIPLTSNGKIDRKSLIGVNLFSPKNFENSSYHSISKTTELTLIRIWEKILNTSNIPTDQSFFTLGGNSILSIRMLFYIQNIFYSNLSIADIFKNQTIESLAILINRKRVKRLIHISFV